MSKTAGFIHLMELSAYEEVIRTLITIAEVNEYFTWREEVVTNHRQAIDLLHERAVLGRFIWNPGLSEPPEVSDAQYVDRLYASSTNFEMLGILSRFLERAQEHSGVEVPLEYYRILKELAILPRSGLGAFRERFALAWEKAAGSEWILPYRFAATTGCSFLIAPLPIGFDGEVMPALEKLTLASKYDLKSERALGVALKESGAKMRDATWMHIEAPWEHDPEMEEVVRTAPLREVERRGVHPYQFEPESPPLAFESYSGMGRRQRPNERCACQSGHKFKFCCGAPPGKRRAAK